VAQFASALRCLLFASFAVVPLQLDWAAIPERENFLSRGPGAAAQGLGQAFTAVASDLTAIYYNPAGLPFVGGGFHAEHTPVFGGGRYNFLGFHYPSRWGSLGFGLIQFAEEGIEGRTKIGDDPQTVKASQTAYFFPYAVGRGPISVGIDLKEISLNLAGTRASAMGADAGVLWSSLLPDSALFADPNLQTGLSARNLVAPSYTLASNGEQFPREWWWGVSLSGGVRGTFSERLSQVVYDRVQLGIDWGLNAPQSTAWRIGLEYAFYSALAIRAGYSGDFSMGVGYRPAGGSFSADYSVALTALAPQHRFSLAFFFSPPRRLSRFTPQVRQYKLIHLEAERYATHYAGLGRDFLKERNYAASLEAFKKASLLSPGNQGLRQDLVKTKQSMRFHEGRLLMDQSRSAVDQRNYAEALKRCFEAAQAIPEELEIRALFSRIKEGLESADPRGAQQYRDLVELTATSGFEEGEQHLRSAHWQEAEHVLAALQILSPQSSPCVNFASEVRDAERQAFDEAFADANAALAKKEYRQAAAGFLKARRLNSSDIQLRREWESFISFYRGSRQFTEMDRIYQAQLYESSAVHFIRGEMPEARDLLEQLLTINEVDEWGLELEEEMMSMDKEGKS